MGQRCAQRAPASHPAHHEKRREHLSGDRRVAGERPGAGQDQRWLEEPAGCCYSVMNRRRKLLEEAWIGDAVLSLYARSLILAEHGAVNSQQLERMTSNQFLAGI